MPELASWVALGGVVGVVMLGSSFLLLPNAPALTVSLGRLVDYANGHHARSEEHTSELQSR